MQNAKKTIKPRNHDSGSVITTKTSFGSDSSMIIDLSEFNSFTLQDTEVVCKDDRGFYLTTKDRIDSGLADPNRYSNSKARVQLEKKEVSSS